MIEFERFNTMMRINFVDDVLNVSGHRLGTNELESALSKHDKVAEAAVVGYPHSIKGQGIYAYVIYQGSHGQDTHGTAEMIRKDLNQTITRVIGAIAKPDKIQFVSGLPKTRSGKIMRRLLKQIAGGQSLTGDTSTLEDLSVLTKLSKGEE
jgi:acetyl-CoA synthetase